MLFLTDIHKHEAFTILNLFFILFLILHLNGKTLSSFNPGILLELLLWKGNLYKPQNPPDIKKRFIIKSFAFVFNGIDKLALSLRQEKALNVFYGANAGHFSICFPFMFCESSPKHLLYCCFQSFCSPCLFSLVVQFQLGSPMQIQGSLMNKFGLQ